MSGVCCVYFGIMGNVFDDDEQWLTFLFIFLLVFLAVITILLGMISHKMSLITIFGLKHKIKNFIKNLIFFMKKFQWHLDFGPYLESNFKAKNTSK